MPISECFLTIQRTTFRRTLLAFCYVTILFGLSFLRESSTLCSYFALVITNNFTQHVPCGVISLCVFFLYILVQIKKFVYGLLATISACYNYGILVILQTFRLSKYWVGRSSKIITLKILACLITHTHGGQMLVCVLNCIKENGKIQGWF